ncbi:tetratricopeptide repeat protein [Dyella caseinilytica]|uniref:Tetratricopeptide repeat protein n=1 Tax=Dyella caseinilytica TaxID=1849581 RepID=A0ABX7GVK6_9GAMM|nr:tetratricopeptide repeat protein [Dyella caseinilytica]QRN54330.1 tetratricopeptide repeat protein [Dyella caseinilytica]GFZ93332.1 tetratricopeptide repeat-containing 2OG-Fe(II) oxygenase [Dyella caseinilytica]
MSTVPPTVIDTMRQVGALLQTGDFRGAHERLQTIVEQHPDYAEALRLLGGVRLAMGDKDGAETLLRRAVAADPGWAPSLATLGELLLNSGRQAEALPLLQRAAQRLPHAALLLARHYNDHQRPTEALAIVAPLCSAGQASADLVTQHIAALAALGRLGEAVTFYRKLAEASPNNPATAHALAIALAAASQHAEAERTTQHALAQGHKSAAVYFTHANSLIALSDFERAEASLRECLRQEPRHIDAHNHLARLVWMRTGDSAQTTAALDQSLQIFQGDEALLAAKAAILQGVGDVRGAYTCLATLTSRAQATPALLVRAGLAALEFDPATALTLAERATQLSPAATAPRNLLAAALLGVGDARRALEHCEALLSAAPDDQYLIALQTTAWRLLGDARYDTWCDYTQLVRPYLLQAPSSWPDLASFLTDLKRSLERLHQTHDHPLLFQSLRHGTETTGDLTREQDPVIQALFQAFDTPIRDYLAYIGEGIDPLRRRNRGNYQYNGGWSVRLRSSGYHANHVHPRGWISSAFYVDLPDGMTHATSQDGCLAFGEPSMATTPALHAQHVVRPEPGRLVLFPSYVWHGTVPFHSEQTRLTVAFDVVPERQG